MNLTQSQVIEVFNNHFSEFLKDIITVFPTEESILRTKKYMETVIATDKRMIITIWKCKIVAGFEGQIMAGNIDFFINKDYSADLAGFGASSEKILQAINDLRGKIAAMSDENKAKTAKYIQNLTQISHMYHLINL